MNNMRYQRSRAWLSAACLGIIAVACTQLPSVGQVPLNNQKISVTVIIKPELTTDFVNKHPQFQLKSMAQTVSKVEENFGIVKDERGEGNFLLDRFVVQMASEEQTSFLDTIAKKQGLDVLDRGEIPQPPSFIPASQTHKIKDRGFRLLGFDPNSSNSKSLDTQRLAERLAENGFKGEVSFSSTKAAQVFEKMLKAKEEQSEIISVEPNWFGTTSIAYTEHRDINYGYSTTNDNNPLYQNRVSGGYNTLGAWNLWAANPNYPSNQNQLSGTGVYVAIIDTGFDTTNYELTGYDPVTNSYVFPKSIAQYDFTSSDYNVNVALNDDCIQGSAPANCYHGTYAAASAVGARGNHYGSAGSAPNASAMLFRVRGTIGFIWYSYIIDFYQAG